MKQDEWMKLIGKINPIYVREAEQWKKRKKKQVLIKQILPMAACVCILLVGAAAGFEYLQEKSLNLGNSNSSQVEEISESAESVESAAMIDEGEMEAEKEKESLSGACNEQIAINPITEMNAYCVDVDAEYVETESLEDFEAYCGVTVLLQEVPEDMTLDTQKAEIAYNKQNSIVADNNRIIYKNESGNRKITIAVRTTESGTIDEFTNEENMKVSKIMDTSLVIGYTEESESYVAIFTKGNVTFCVRAEGLSEEELLHVLRQLC